MLDFLFCSSAVVVFCILAKNKDKRICDPIDEEHCRRPSSFLLVNRLKAIVPVRSSRDGVRHRSILLCYAQAGNRAWNIKSQYDNLRIVLYHP